MRFTRCPLCGAPNIVHPGEPPANEPHTFRNRCTANALTGGTNHSGGVTRSASACCGFPLTDARGNIIPFDSQRFVKLTRREFDAGALESAICADAHV